MKKLFSGGVKAANVRALLCVLVILACAAVLFQNTDNYTKNPFLSGESFMNPSYGVTDAEGAYYIIDMSRKRIVKTDADFQFLYDIMGGSESYDKFYFVQELYAEQGDLYITDLKMDASGTYVVQERILRFNDKGKFDSVVYTHDYPEDGYPMKDGRISSLHVKDGVVSFAMNTADAIGLYQVRGDGQAAEIKRFPLSRAAQTVISAAVDYPALTLYFIDKKANLLQAAEDGNHSLLYAGHAGQDIDEDMWSIPYSLAVTDDGQIYFSDTGSRDVNLLSGGAKETVLARDADYEPAEAPIYYRISARSAVTATDTFQVVTIGADGTRMSEGYTYGLAIRVEMFALWLPALLCAAAVCVLLQTLLHKLKGVRLSPTGRNGLLMAVAALTISAAVSLMLLPDQYVGNKNAMLTNISNVTHLISQMPVGDHLENIRSADDYDSPDYVSLRKTMDKIMENIQDNNVDLYYLFYKTNGSVVYGLMDYENTLPAMYPMDTMYEDSDYQIVMETGAHLKYDAIADSTGLWSYALGPIYNSHDEIVGICEIGTNLFSMDKAFKKMIVELLLAVLTLTVVIIFVFTEMTMFATFLRARDKAADQALPSGDAVIDLLRPLMFMFFAADCMQNAFVPLLVSRLYTPIFNLPLSVGIAVPLSAEVVSTAVFAFTGGFIVEKIGAKRAMTLGAVIAAAGFSLCAMAGGIYLFIIGKLVTGVGMGLLVVSANMIAAMPADEERRSRGFVQYNTGLLSGVNVGVVFGSMLAGPLGYAWVYWISGVIMLLALCMVLAYVPARLSKEGADHGQGGRSDEADAPEGKISLARFLVSPAVLRFILLCFVPYTIAAYFLHFFFPLYADSNGMTESAIGQIFLINGLILIYLGPALSKYIIGKFGSRPGLTLSAAIYVGALLLFALNPSVVSAIAAVVLLGLADGFGFNAQSVYYSGLKPVLALGSGKAMGVYNMFENISQTAAPFVFGSALLLGNSVGVLVIGAGLGILSALFLISGGRSAKTLAKKQKEPVRSA